MSNGRKPKHFRPTRIWSFHFLWARLSTSVRKYIDFFEGSRWLKKMFTIQFSIFLDAVLLHKEMTTTFLLEKYRMFFIFSIKLLSLKFRSFLEKRLQTFMATFCMIFILLTMAREFRIYCYLTHIWRNLAVLLPLFLHTGLTDKNITPKYWSWSCTQSKLLLPLINSV